MFNLIVRFLINALAIWVAAYLVEGMTLDTENVAGFAVVVLVFGIVNALLKPVVTFLSIPFIILTLGIFALVINAGLLWLTAWLTDSMVLTGFWPAFWGAIVVSLVSWFVGMFVAGSRKKKRRRKPR
jgi:putative membrane protein